MVCASWAIVWLHTASDCMASDRGLSLQGKNTVIELKLDDDRVGVSRCRPGAGMSVL